MSDTAEIAKTFLSHNSRDKPAVEVIQGLLERGDLQRADRPIPCWFDKDDLRSQGTWMSQLEDAVANCGAAVVFFGPDGHGPVHKYEIDLLLKRAMYEQGRDAIRLVLVLLPGAQESAIQGFISLHMWADFRKGLDDAAALQRLRAYILGEAPKSRPGDDPKVPKPKIEPYRGLEPFEGKHAIYFFGRDNEIKELCGRLREWPFTAVIGGSGSGKSSIVRAGLQTELATQQRPALARTTTITVRPGSNPIRALADQVAASLPDQSVTERLKLVEDFDQQFRTASDKLLNVLSSLYPKDDQHILLVIDQFEELFTHSSDNRPAEPSPPGSPPPETTQRDSQQTQFVELLAAVAKSQLDRLRIVITLRADFFDRCLSVPTLKSLIENRTLLLGNLSDEALRTVIEAPAFQVRAYFEKGLVARILKDVENQNGSLPLLQHALKELWEQRRFGFLTDDAYDETGGVEGALKKRANATLQNLSEDQRDIAKNVFLRLTTLGEGVSDTRRRVRKTELYPEKADPRVIDEVLKGLSSQANRLIVTNDDGTVEVTHEALIQRWDTLKGWLADNRDDKRMHDRLRDAANEWADLQHKRDPSYLWEGGRLDLAEKFDQTHPNMLTALEREFLGASIAKREHTKSQKEEAEREKLRQQEALTAAEAARARLAEEKEAEARVNTAKQSRLKQVGYVVAGVALFAAVIAGWQTWSASTARNTAQQQQAEANRDNASFYWRFAVNARRDDEPLKAAHMFLRGAESLGQIVPALRFSVDTNGIAHDGLAASALDQSLVRSWVHDAPVLGCTFNSDESRVLTWSFDDAARLWDTTKPKPLQTFKHHNIVKAAFDHNESRVLTWSSSVLGISGEARLWDVTKSESIHTFKSDIVKVAQFNRDASRVLSWNSDMQALQLWNAITNEPMRTFKQIGLISHAEVSADASRVLTWSEDRKVMHLWDVIMDKPEQIQEFTFDDGRDIGGAVFSPSKSRVLTWSRLGGMRLFDVTKPEPIQTFDCYGAINGARFSRDESRVLTWEHGNGVFGGQATLWDVTKKERMRNFPHEASVNGAQFSRDELLLLTWSVDKTARLWDVSKPESIQTFKHDDAVTGAQFSQDESRVLTCSSDKTTRLWKVIKLPILLLKTDGKNGGVKIAPSASRLLTWSYDAEERKAVAQLWDMTIPEPIQIFKHDHEVYGAQFSHDESQVLTWGRNSTTKEGDARLWDVAKSDPLRIFKHKYEVYDARFSRDESHVLTLSRRKLKKTIRDETRLFDVTLSDPIRIFEHHNKDKESSYSGVCGTSVRGNEMRVLTWNHDSESKKGEMQLWDVTKSEPLQTFKNDPSVFGAQFCRNESRFLTWNLVGETESMKSEARLWDVTKPEPIQTFKHDSLVNGVVFSRDESRVLTWSNYLGGRGGTAHLWDVTKTEPIQTFKHEGGRVNGTQFNRDELLVLTWSEDNTARLWDLTKPDPILTLNHHEPVEAAQFNCDTSRVLTVSGNSAWNWDIADPLAALTPTERILELEVRSGATLDEQLNLRTLNFDEWQAKVKSAEYRAIEQKLAARPLRNAQKTEATNDMSADADHRSKPTTETKVVPK